MAVPPFCFFIWVYYIIICRKLQHFCGGIGGSVIFIMKKARSAGLWPVTRAVFLLLMLCEFWLGGGLFGKFFIHRCSCRRKKLFTPIKTLKMHLTIVDLQKKINRLIFLFWSYIINIIKL